MELIVGISGEWRSSETQSPIGGKMGDAQGQLLSIFSAL